MVTKIKSIQTKLKQGNIKNIGINKKLLSAIIGSTLVIPSINFAANKPKDSDENNKETSDALVVEGSWLGNGTEDDVKTYPGSRSVITNKQIVDSGATDIQDVLQQIPSVRIEDETAGTGVLPNISVRGLNPLRSVDLQALLNGVPLALGPYSSTGLSLFPVTIDMIDRIDIVRGGAAVQYGPNNVGGVLNIITKPIPEKYTTQIKQSITSAPTGKLLPTSYLRTGGFLSDNFGAQLQANVTRGNGDREHTFTKIDNFLYDMDYWLTTRDEFKTELQYYHADAELPGALTPQEYSDNWRQSVTPNNRYTSEAYRSSLNYSHYFDNGSQFNWMNYYVLNHRNFIFQSPVNVGTTPTSIDQSPRVYQFFGPEPSYTFTTHFLTKQKFIIGACYLREGIDYPVYSQNISTGINTTKRDWGSSTNAYSAYISDTLYFYSDRLQITPGIRLESVTQNFVNHLDSTQNVNSDKTNTNNDLLPGITIGYQATKDLYLFTNAQRSLLPPQMTQVANSNGSDLTAELANNYEVGFRWKINEDIATTITLFRTDFDNKIEKNQSDELINVGKSRQQGIETQLKLTPYFIKHLDLTFGYTILDAKILDGENAGNRLPYTSKNQLSFVGNYNYKGWNFNVSGYYYSSAFSDPQNTDPETADGSQGPIPAYWLWNAAIVKDYDFSDNTKLQISLAVHNIFNEEYYFRNVDVSGGITPAPGRSVTLSGMLTF